MPSVSVVIPAFERRDLTAEAVDSVLRQTVRDLELVVVDDGSRDGTGEHVLQRFGDPRVRVVRQENLGVSAARNRGARETSGEWVAFLDSDDLWLPRKLERQLAALESDPGRVACYTEEVWHRNGRWANPRKIHAKPSGLIFARCLPLCVISPSSVVIRRDVFETLGGFDESLPACEDYDLWLRLAARHPIHLVPERLIVKRNGHPGQLSQAFPALDRFRVRCLWKIALDSDLPWETRRQALETAAQKSKIVSQGAAKRGARDRSQVFHFSHTEALRWLETGPGSR